MLGVQPIKINSALVSAQNRNRLYWTNVQGFVQPADRHVDFNSILEPLENTGFNLRIKPKMFDKLNGAETLTNGACKIAKRDRCQNTNRAVCLQARDYKGIPGREHCNAAMQNGILRRLTTTEHERL